jgi:hypothetical protein
MSFGDPNAAGGMSFMFGGAANLDLNAGKQNHEQKAGNETGLPSLLTSSSAMQPFPGLGLPADGSSSLPSTSLVFGQMNTSGPQTSYFTPA